MTIPPFVQILWEDEPFRKIGPIRLLKVVDADGNVVGQLPIIDVTYEPSIHGPSTMSIKLNIQRAAIGSRLPDG